MELKEETSRLNKLKHLLILFSRLLVIFFLVIAFAQPFIPSGQAARGQSGDPVSIYLDNSFSMDAVSSEGAMLEVAKRKAKEIILSYPASTRFQLLTNDFEAFQQRLNSKEDALDEIERVKLSPVSRKLSEVLLRQKEVFSGASSGSGISYILSDFQQSTTDLDAIKNDSSVQVTLVSLPKQENANLFIDSCWLSSPVVQINQAVELTVRIRNSSSEKAENVPVKLMLNGAQKAVSSLNPGPDEAVTTTFSFTISQPGWQKAEISLTDHPVNFDDTYYFSFEVREKLNVLSIYDGFASPYTGALFNHDPYFNFINTGTGNVDYSGFTRQDLIILDDLAAVSSGLSEELRKYVDGGGTLCVFPDSSFDADSWRSFLSHLGADIINGINRSSDKVAQLDLSNALFEGVFDSQKLKEGKTDYPVVSSYFDYAFSSQSKRQVLMRLTGGSPFLSYYPLNHGSIYVFAVPLNPGFSNLASHAVFAPLLYRMALLSSKPLAFANKIGEASPVVLNIPAMDGDEVFHLLNEEQHTDIIPASSVLNSNVMINAGDEIKSSGHYDLMKGNSLKAVISFNYDRQESVMKFYNEEALFTAFESKNLSNWKLLKAAVEDLGKTLTMLNKGVSLWKYAVALALFFLLVETLLIRFWKKT